MTQVLIIDDEPQIRRFLNICLGSQGYQLLEAEDAKIAEDEAREDLQSEDQTPPLVA